MRATTGSRPCVAVARGVERPPDGERRSSGAMTMRLLAGGLWAEGEPSLLNSAFDRQLVVDGSGRVEPAQSYGGWVEPIFYLTDTVSLRWAGGVQYAIDSNDRVLTGDNFTEIDGDRFFRTRNRQSEVSVWWAPGPWTFALAWNYTTTDYKRVDPVTSAITTRTSDVHKFELITWFSF